MGWSKIEPGIWKPEKADDAIQGIVIGRESGEDYSNKYYVKDKDNQTWLVWGCTILDDRMKLVSDGAVVRIVFEGHGKNSKGQMMNLYSVYTYTPDPQKT